MRSLSENCGIKEEDNFDDWGHGRFYCCGLVHVRSGYGYGESRSDEARAVVLRLELAGHAAAQAAREAWERAENEEDAQ